MEAISEQFGQLGGSSKSLAGRLMTIGESRIELFLLELVEEREHFIRSLVMALGIFALGLLALMALTAAIVIGLRALPPVLTLAVLAALYVAGACVLAFLLRQSMRKADPFSATIDQLRKDRASIERQFS
jgi:uncharacterized membrane protein YqjE